jgi:uncharacterized protein
VKQPIININETTNHFYELTWKEVQLPMRDGSYLAANLYQPDSNDRFPVLMTMGPYGKDAHFSQFAPINPTIIKEYSHLQDKGPLVSWETPNPEFWVPQGYAVLRIDERGIGNSPGKLDILSASLKKDFYDAIEWAGTQPWSNGKVGLLGISYFAMSQWAVASEQPPHLACIIPWEGTVDYYAEFCYPGGILANGFLAFWWKNGVLPHQHNPGGKFSAEQLRENRVEFPEIVKKAALRNEFWENRSANLSKVKVPVLSASNWFSAGMHTRGNFLGFQHAASEHKWLEVHIGSHVAGFYTEKSPALQKKFLDYWLKGIDTGLMREPKVKLAIPRGGKNYTWHYENEYPLKRTQWTRLYLDAGSAQLTNELPQTAASYSYEGDKDRESVTWAKPMQKPFDKTEACSKRILFETAPFEQEAEIIGPIKLRLWASSSTDDMDIFVSLRNIDPEGNEVVNSGALSELFPISKGWLRASLRKTDENLSTEYKPYYTFDEVQKLIPGEPYPLEIEIWDSAIVLAKGHRLLLEIGSQSQSGFFMLETGEDRIWDADVTLYTGGKFDTHLLLPVIP